MKSLLKKYAKRSGYVFGIAVVAIVVGISLQFAKAWTEPSQSAPNGNVGAPITTNGGQTIKSSTDGILNFQTTDNSWLYTQWLTSAGVRRAWMGFDVALDFFHIKPENGSRGVILGGNVGIGTDSNIKLAVGDNDTGLHSTGDGQLDVYSNNVNTMSVRSGNVGLGKTDPQANLHIAVPDNDTSSLRVSLAGATGSGNGHDRYFLNMRPVTASGVVRWVYDQQNDSTNYPSVLAFDRGNVGIGTTGPRNDLEVGDTSSNQTIRIGGIYRGSGSGFTGVGQETDRHQLVFSSWRDAVTDTIGAKIVAINKTAYDATGWDKVQNTDLAFFTLGTMPSGSDNTSEKMRITSSGNIGIGKTGEMETIDIGGGNSYGVWPAKLGVNGSIRSTRADVPGQYLELSSGIGGTYLTAESETGLGWIENTKPLIINNKVAANTSGGGNIQFQIGSSTKAFIGYGGNVGIGTGTTDPSIKLAVGDSDTGLHSTGDGQLDVYSNNVNTMSVRSGDVGIGTTTPQANLHITASDTETAAFRISDLGNPGAYYLNMKPVVTSGVIRWVFNQRNNNTDYLNVMAFDRGNVGIGTTNPLSKLSVGGDGVTGTTIYAYSSTTTAINGSSSSNGAGVYGDSQTGNGVKGSSVYSYGGYFTGSTGAYVSSCPTCSVLAEMVPVVEKPNNGDVMCIDSENGKIEICNEDKSRNIKGIAQKKAEQIMRMGCANTLDKENGSNGMNLGVKDVDSWQNSSECKGWYPIALSGLSEETNVVCKTPNGKTLGYGDILVSSSVPGHLRPLDDGEEALSYQVAGKVDSLCSDGKDTDSIQVWIQ